MLSPPYDSKEKDLGGAILATGESVAETNGTIRPSRPRLENGPARGEDRPSSRPDNHEENGGASTRNSKGAGNDRMPGSSDHDNGDPPGQGREKNAKGERPGAEILKQQDRNSEGQTDKNERPLTQQKPANGSMSGTGANIPTVQISTTRDANH